MANAEHVALVRKGAKAIAEWRQAHPKECLDLTKFRFGLAYLAGADLAGANLGMADFGFAMLMRANLSGANLRLANLSLADLSYADLGGADLQAANLSLARLSGADLSRAILGSTSLGRLDLSKVRGLPDVLHNDPSSICVDTLIASYRGAGNKLTRELTTFFRGAGVPQELLDALPKIVSEIKYCDSFLCYGEPDRKLARRLSEDLRARGASCWWHPKSKTVGERTWPEITKERRRADKMIVLCSAKALVRDGVLKEIEEQIDEDPDKMVPISLDSLWKEPGFKVMRNPQARDLKPFLMERNYADFGNKPYDEALEELLRGLRRPEVKKPRRKKG